MRRRALMAAVAAVALGAAASATAAEHTTTETARFGGVLATFSYTGTNPDYRNERLVISSAGAVLWRAAVRSQFCDNQCWPGSLPGRRGSVHVVDLEHNGTVDVVLDLYSGGAHCCSVEQIFTVTPGSSRVTMVERNFGDPGARLVDLRHDRRLSFLTADDRFAYAFTSFAGSGLPIQVLTYSRGRFTDVTRRYPGRIRGDAAEWLRIYRSFAAQHWSDTVGVIAAWAADEDLLGRESAAARFLAQEARLGHLNSADPSQPSGERYVAALTRFLRRLGYQR